MRKRQVYKDPILEKLSKHYLEIAEKELAEKLAEMNLPHLKLKFKLKPAPKDYPTKKQQKIIDFVTKELFKL